LFVKSADHGNREASNEKEMISDEQFTSESDDEDSVERNAVLLNA
jgi:hypothetical protein